MTFQEYNNIHWIEEDEFLWQGVMHDVVKKVITSDSVEIICISDEAETFFLSMLHEVEEDAGSEKKPLKKWSSDEYLNPEDLHLISSISAFTTNITFITKNVLFIFFDTLIKPPEGT